MTQLLSAANFLDLWEPNKTLIINPNTFYWCVLKGLQLGENFRETQPVLQHSSVPSRRGAASEWSQSLFVWVSDPVCLHQTITVKTAEEHTLVLHVFVFKGFYLPSVHSFQASTCECVNLTSVAFSIDSGGSPPSGRSVYILDSPLFH